MTMDGAGLKLFTKHFLNSHEWRPMSRISWNVNEMSGEVKAILGGMGSSNVERRVLRLFSHEMIPEG